MRPASMNDKLTILFPDEEAARYIESRRWPNGPRCPVCASDRIGAHSPGIYRCYACEASDGEKFTVRTGTVMERSKIPLVKWLHAMYLIVTSRRGISSIQLSKELSITQKSAWFLLRRLREACGRKLDTLRGSVEIDETYIGGIEHLRPILDQVLDTVLTHRPKPKSKPAKQRERRRRKIQRQSSMPIP